MSDLSDPQMGELRMPDQGDRENSLQYRIRNLITEPIRDALLREVQKYQNQKDAERAALYAELAMLHAEKAAVETAIQRVQARLDGRVQDWRELVDFTQAAQR